MRPLTLAAIMNSRTNTLISNFCRQISHKFSGNSELTSRIPDASGAVERLTESLVTPDDDQSGHDGCYAADVSKTAGALGYRLMEIFESELDRTVEWRLGNEKWWRLVIGRSYGQWIEVQYSSQTTRNV